MDRNYEKEKEGQEGIWCIRGEDPNCDFGGNHRKPILGYAEGKYEIVWLYAQSLPQWCTWGDGGSLELIEIKKINKEKLEKLHDLETQKKYYETEIENLKERIKELETK